MGAILTEAAGLYRMGENRRAAAVFARRLYRGRYRYGFAGFLAAAFLAVLLANRAANAMSGGDAALMMLCRFYFIIAALLIVGFVYVRWRDATLRKMWGERGVIDPRPISFTLCDTGLTIIEPWQATRVTWPGISEITPSREHWIIFAVGIAWCLPRRFFLNSGQERAFIAKVVRHLTPQALARSPEAVAFATLA
jgi:hypothetical protein